MRKFLKKNDKLLVINTDADKKLKNYVKSMHNKDAKDFNFITDSRKKFSKYFNK